MTQYPYTNRPEDVEKLLDKLKGIEPPPNKVDAAYLKNLGFSPSSGRYLLDIMRKIGFVDAEDKATAIWKDYAISEQRGLALASRLKDVYPKLFKSIFCPYLESDESLLEFFRNDEPELTARERGLVLMTFRALSGPADFQDLMCSDETSESAPSSVKESASGVRVDPRIHIDIQIHIDPATPDDKIETIFKNMQRYLLDRR